VSRYDWMDSAACAQVDPEIFHPTGNPTRQAKNVCARCPVQRQCASFAHAVEGEVSHPHRHGLWAGMSARDRAGRAVEDARLKRDDTIWRLHTRGGMTADEIGVAVGCDARTVYRVLKQTRGSYKEAA
jgi:WhiB family redox-sensing transcriptional regulator